MPLQDRHRLVGRAVIDDDCFIIGELLRLQRIKRRTDIPGAVISRNNDRKEHQLPKSTLLFFVVLSHSRGTFDDFRCRVKRPRGCS